MTANKKSDKDQSYNKKYRITLCISPGFCCWLMPETVAWECAGRMFGCELITPRGLNTKVWFWVVGIAGIVVYPGKGAANTK